MNEASRILLDNTIPFDANKVLILDQVVDAMYGKNPEQIAYANKILNELKSNQDFWLSTDVILTNSRNSNTKFISMIILEDAIKTRWNIIPNENKESIRNYIMNMVITMADSEINDKALESLLTKANTILVEHLPKSLPPPKIVKFEWNTTWKSFIPDICRASTTSQTLCENNLSILKILSEEIFDFSKNQMTSQQIKELKMQMNNEFKSIFDLCYFILKSYLCNSSSVKPTLMRSCLETLYAFLSWIPLNYIFSNNFIQEILVNLIDQQPAVRILTLKCLSEIVVIKMDSYSPEENQMAKPQLYLLFQAFLQKLTQIIPVELSLVIERTKVVRSNPKQVVAFDNLCQQMALFLTNFFSTHLGWLVQAFDSNINISERLTFLELAKKGLQYLVLFTELPDEQIYKICIEFWHFLTGDLVKSQGYEPENHSSLLMLCSQPNPTFKNVIVPHIMPQIRKIIISRMAKPQEVLIVIDENGAPQREILENTENNSLYEILRETCINLSRLDWENMKSIISNKLEKQLDGSEWSFDNLNSLCWAMGSISGTLPEQEERHFLIMTIRTLLNLCEMKKGKENKAVVASNIMYVVGQYPKFLKANWNFLKTVVKKLFEFMHETFPGVMEMACNTFIKIAQKCKEEFVIPHTKADEPQGKTIETDPYIYELIRKIPEETSMLDNQNKTVFFEAVGYIISAEQDLNNKANQINDTLSYYFSEWSEILNNSGNMEFMRQDAIIEKISFFLRVNERLAFSIGSHYHIFLQKIYIQAINLYGFYSNIVNLEFNAKGKHILNFSAIKKLRTVKRDILRLLKTFFESTRDAVFVSTHFVSPLGELLKDFITSPPDTREHEVIALFAVIVDKLEMNVNSFVPQWIDVIFESTLLMITSDFNSYIDFRMSFFQFLKAVIEKAFLALFNIPASKFKTMIDCLVWAFKHELPTIFDIGLDLLLTVLKNVNSELSVANQFYQLYHTQLLTDLLYVLTDNFHRSGFKKQVQILNILIDVSGSLAVPIDPQNVSNPSENTGYVYQYILNLLSSAFLNTSKQTSEAFVNSLFMTVKNFNEFKNNVRDYLVQLSHFTNDLETFYNEEDKK